MRLNLALMKWQNSKWEKDLLVFRPSSNLQAKHIQAKCYHFVLDAPHPERNDVILERSLPKQ